MKSLARTFLLLALCAVAVPQEASAALVQGTGVGTLPGRTVNRAVPAGSTPGHGQVKPGGIRPSLHTRRRDGLWGTRRPAPTSCYGRGTARIAPRPPPLLGDGRRGLCGLDRFTRRSARLKDGCPSTANTQ
jgi:hypothetical protein